MASKNNFKGVSKALLSKTGTFIIERKDEKYYITNGQMILMLDELTYDNLLRPLSPMFIQLADGQVARTEAKNELPKVDKENRIFVCETYKSCVKDEHGYVKTIGFYYKANGKMLEIFECGNELATFDTKYSEPFVELATLYGETPKGAGTWNSSIYFDGGQCGMLILPVNYEQNFIQQKIDKLNALKIKGRT